MKKLFFVFLLYLLNSCSNYGQLTLIHQLPKKLDENSGIVSLNKSSVWMIEDNGNTNDIFQVDFDGNILKKIEIENAKNKDWEDLAKDEKGNIYIADFGNNENKRKDLVIYKIPNPETKKGSKIKAERITFNYPEQTKFPPKKNKLWYDAEALFYKDNSLFIITKNRAIPFTGEALIYKIPSKAGSYEAQYIGTFNSCKDDMTCKITSADISPNGKKIVLLSNGKLWIFTDFFEDNFTKGSTQTIDLGIYTQLESVCFVNDTKLLLSDEQDGNTGRNLYSYTLEE